MLEPNDISRFEMILKDLRIQVAYTTREIFKNVLGNTKDKIESFENSEINKLNCNDRN